MKFGTREHRWPMLGFGCQLSIEGYATQPRRAGARWHAAMEFVADHL